MTARYCGQANVLMGYGRVKPQNPYRWGRLRKALAEHRATCITCRAR